MTNYQREMKRNGLTLFLVSAVSFTNIYLFQLPMLGAIAYAGLGLICSLLAIDKFVQAKE